MASSNMLAFRDENDTVASLESKIFGKASKAKLRRNSYIAVLNQLAKLQEKNGYTQEEMAVLVATLATVPLDFSLNVSVRTKKGGN